ncbi:MAG: hypothetical protein PHX01_01375 [Clostridia bacterium]|nr:hypothetical protein [Clostridia bacterium]
MPRLNRIRVTNIQYDHGKKQLPDLLFDVKSLDTLFILANGGGKSLLVQLILQVILPNSRMGKRKVEDLLQAGHYTGHIAVEWLLDSSGERRQFLCTGFCFSGGQNTERPLRYYNYLFDYDDRSELTIEDLPFINTEEKRPIQYQKLKDWLRENGIQPLERVEAYQERLKIYQILPEEWKNIRKTNGDEGGVDKFFEKSKSTRQLMDNLLIPSVEEMIFQDEQKKQELFHAFTQYREMLLEIPVIKQNLQDFALIRDAAEGVVEEVEVLNQRQKTFTAQTKEIVRLARSFYEFTTVAQKAVEQLEQEKETVTMQYKDLEWQERSYQWFLRKLELSKAKLAENCAQEEYKQAEGLWQKAEDNENRLQALYYFNEVQKAAREELKFRRQLELMEQAEPELQVLLTQKKQVLRFAWQERKTEIAKQLCTAEEALVKLREEKEVLSEEKKEAKLKQRELTKKIAVVENWLAEYKKKRQDLLNLVETAEVLDPAASLQKRYAILQHHEQREAETIERQRLLVSQREELEQTIFNLGKEKYQLEIKVKSLEEKLARQQTEEDHLRGTLSAQGIYLKSLLAEKEVALLRVKDLLREVQERKLSLQAELANLQEKWALVEGRDYYVPHHDLLRIKNRLERAGVYTVLGSEWLAEQFLTEPEKEAVLQNQPFLPFTILLEANQVNTVKHIVRQGKEWTCDVPLLFLVKSAATLQGEERGENFFPLWQEELYLFRPDTFSVYTSTESFLDLKNRMQEKIKIKQQEVAEEVGQERLLLSLQEKLANFYYQYPAEMVQEWEEEKKQLQANVLSLAQEIEAEEIRKKQLQEEGLQLEKLLVEIVLVKEKLKEIIGKLEAFNSLHLLYPKQETEQKELAEKLQQVELRLAKKEERLIAISGEEVEKKNRIKDLGTQREEHEEDFSKYRLTGIEPKGEELVDYNRACIEVEGILAQLNEKQSERANIQELLEKTIKQREDALFEVERTGIEKEWLKQNQRLVNRKEITAAGQKTKEHKVQGEEKKKVWEETQITTRTVQNLVEHIAEEIKQDFSKEPYDAFTKADHSLEIASLKQQKSEVKKRIEKILGEIKKETEWQKETGEAYEMVLDIMPEEIEHLWTTVTPYADEEWVSCKVTPRKLLTRSVKERSEGEAAIERQKNIVSQQFERYLHKLETTNNVKIGQFIRDVKTIMADNRLYDYEFVQDQFLRIFEGLDQYENQYKNTLVECEKNKEHLVDLCLRRAGSVYDSVCEIPKNSRVKIYDRAVQVIRLDWPRRDEQESRERMNYYLEQALEDLQVYKQQGKNDDEINSIMETKLRTRNLIEQIAPLENCKVTVYKPRQETMIRHDKLEYRPWDEVPKWSGGEEYSVYMTMFMIMLTHIRQQLEGWRHVWKVLLADNPFGKASSSHVWEPVFQIAKANRIQLICFTAHKEDDILKRFPVVYSLQLRSAYGKEIMQAELMESGFYRLDTASGDGAQMMLPL